MMMCDTAMAIPRLIPTLVAPKVNEFAFSIRTDSDSYGCVLINPSFYTTVKYLHTGVGTGDVSELADYNWSSFYSAPVEYFLAVPLTYSPAGVVGTPLHIQQILKPVPSGAYMSSTGHVQLGNNVYFPGTIDIADHQFQFYNSDSASLQYEFKFYSDMDTSTPVTVQTVTGTVNGKSEAVINFNTAIGVFSNFAWSFAIINQDVIGHVPSGMSFQPRQNLGAGSFDASYTGDATWARYSFIQNANFSHSLRSQILNASSISYTGMTIIVTNDTSQLIAGGHIVACQLPADSAQKLPYNGRQLFEYISTQTRRPILSGELKDGGFGIWTPDKLEDYFFRANEVEQRLATQASEYYDRPFLAFAWRAPSYVGAAQQLTFTVRLRSEIISEDNSMSYLPGPHDPYNLVANYLAIANTMMLLSENPTHWENVKEWAGKIVSNPVFQSVAKATLSAGVTALTALI